MSAIDHPEYGQEREHLDHTLLYIYQEMEKLKEPIVVQAADNRAAQSARRTMVSRASDLKDAKQQPYFGRVDWESSGHGRPDEFYIGKCSLPDVGVYYWADTLVADLYYTQTTAREPGHLLLKRTFDIHGDLLQAIRDEYVHPSQEHRTGQIIDKFTDALLATLLRSHRTGQLHDIVASLQAQQYAIIRSPRDQLLVVQGVTGSGKTEIALHRIAFLLYNHRASGAIQPKNVLVLGPNQVFINYISNVLPQLGERQIPQSTFDRWLAERLGTPVEYEPQDASLELLLDPQLPIWVKAMRYRNACNKGSLKMAALIDRYVEVLHEELLNNSQSLECSLTLVGSNVSGDSNRVRFTGTRSVDTLRVMLDSLRSLPLNARRDALKERILRDMSQALQKEVRNRFPREDFGDAITNQLRPQIDQYFSGWKSLNVSVGYRRMLRTPHLLQQAGEGIFSRWDLELLAQDAPTALRPFRFSDLGALVYLKLKLDGSDGVRYDHIVIDEAQDITPLHFKVLHEYSRDNSMTVLGDLAQGIYPYHGVAQWDELVALVGTDALTQETLRQSYRSTIEIIEFANALLARIGIPESELAEPVARSGPTPVLQQCVDITSLLETISEAISTERVEGHTSIAIICKTAKDCESLAVQLEGRTEFQLLTSRDDRYLGATAIIPSYLTKGLEFDTVIIADAQASTYRSDNLDARLLYVTLTRASHSLYVFWTGIVTPLLDADIHIVELQPSLEGRVETSFLTIEDYVQTRSGIDADYCVERLARADKLRLMQNGLMESVVLDVLMQSFEQRRGADDEEFTIAPLEESLVARLREIVDGWESEYQTGAAPDSLTPDGPNGGALALAQLCFGLLRNQLRAAGLDTSDEIGALLGDQVVQMVTLLRAVDQGLALSLGRWTTRQRALQAVSDELRSAAEDQLTLLVSHGIVEEREQRDRLQIRVLPERMSGILALGLGYVPNDWDEDLLAELPRLPQALTWRMPEEI